MSTPPEHESREESQFAELLDELLNQVQDGLDPDPDVVAAHFPSVAHRAKEALSLAANLAGRKVSSRPTLDGYEILRELGRGGMGTVYLAKQSALQREVALKVLPHSFGLSQASRQRFLEEARALAHIKHDHIVDIHRIVDEGELLAFEMEFVDGPSLHSVLADMRTHLAETGSPPTLAQISTTLGIPEAELGTRNLMLFFVRLLLKVARALAAVHAAGFVHRDVKPANILLRANGDPVLVDFGLVRLNSLEVTQAGRFAGTPVYSSPEQLRGDVAVGPTADVYSLGITLYECLTLVTPFAGRTTTDVLQRIEQGRLRPLRRIVPTVPRDLETIVNHAIEIDSLQRYANASELADDLQRLLELHPIQARPVHVVRRVGKFLRRNRKTLIAAAAGAMMVTAAMLPILHNADAATRAEQSASEHINKARLSLIRVDSGSVEWRHTVWGSTSRPRIQTSGKSTRWLWDAAAEYELATQLVANDPVVAQEQHVVRLAIWLQDLTIAHTDTLATALDSAEFRDITDTLGAVTVRAARLMAGETGAALTKEEIAASDNPDRKSLGLLAYLFGDFRLCEQAWSQQDTDLEDHPLIDAGLGRLLLADGMPEPAYLRLVQAQRHFPNSTTLPLELADAALNLGDLNLAEQWLAKVPEHASSTTVQRRLRLDLRAAAEVGADLAPDYERLLREDPYDPTARHRLAQLAMRRGDLATAERHLDTLLAGWPLASEFRLDRARVALQRRDLAGYAKQVLAVLDQEFGRNRSRGTTADLLEILRIGGLEQLYIEGIAATNHESAGRKLFGGEIAIHSFASPTLTRNFGALAKAIHRIQQQVRKLHSPERRIDALAEQLLVDLPIACQQLQIESAFSPTTRLSARILPWLGPLLYERIQPTLKRLLLTFRSDTWQQIKLPVLAAPDDMSAGAFMGHQLITVDDHTGDGIEEVLVACPVQSPSDGEARVLLMDGRTSEILASLAGDSPHHLFGHTIATIRDLDGDGFDEWLIGAPSGTSDTRHGQVEVWSGGKRQLLHQLVGDEPGFGASIASLGDCDGDGCPDFAVASPPLLRNSAAQGKVQVFSGRTYAPIVTWRNDQPGVWFGACIANAQDVDGDGSDDLIVGGNYSRAPGLVRIYSVSKRTVLHSWADPSPASGFGSFVGPALDVDQDGCADVIVSSLGSDATVDQVFVYSGRTGQPLASLPGDKSGDQFGKVAIPVRQPNGTVLLAIGAPFAGSPSTGSVELKSLAGEQIALVYGPIINGAFGWSLTTTSDCDRDLLPELFVAGPNRDRQGKVWHALSASWLSR